MKFDMSSPRARARGQYHSRQSFMAPNYRQGHGELLALTAEQRPTPRLDLTPTRPGFTGMFGFGQRPAYRALLPVGKIICTYVIQHRATGQAYVGSTEDFMLRWRRHVQLLRAGGHANHCLQALFDQDGIDAFQISIVRSYPNTTGLIGHEVEASQRFPLLINLRVGMSRAEDWAARHRTRAQPYRAVRPRGPQQRARWYDGQAVQS